MSKFFQFQDSVNECWRIVNIDKIITIEKTVKFNNVSFLNEEKILMVVEFGNAVKTFVLSKMQYDKLQKLISNENNS